MISRASFKFVLVWMTILSLSVLAQAATFTGAVTGASPTYQRPTAFSQGATCALSGVGTAVHYTTQQFTLASPTNVTISLLPEDGATVTPAGADTFLILYGPGAFNPAAGCTNAITANDDANASTLLSKIVTTTPLAAGTYTLVVTTFDNVPDPALPYNYTGFSSVPFGSVVPGDANVDFNGDGKTDWVVARGTNTPGLTEADGLSQMSVAPYDPEVRLTPGTRARARKVGDSNLLAPPIYWYVKYNGAAGGSTGPLGDAATDFLTPEDFDGDGKDDPAVWTPGPPSVANFKIFQTSTNTIRTEIFGQEGDDPAIVGDYDGDNKADPAVFRCPAIGTGDGQCYFFYKGSNNNPGGNITFVPWGFGEDGDFFPLIGDFDGDGKFDYCIQRANPNSPSQGQFVLLKSQTLGVEFINWGLSSDFLIPGDYDGDGKWDFVVRRTVNGGRQNWVLLRTGATGMIPWGITGDVSTPGDYDGDGKTDIAIWRPSTNPDQNYFWVLNSNGFTLTQFEWGQCPNPLANDCDFPVAGWAVH